MGNRVDDIWPSDILFTQIVSYYYANFQDNCPTGCNIVWLGQVLHSLYHNMAKIQDTIFQMWNPMWVMWPAWDCGPGKSTFSSMPPRNACFGMPHEIADLKSGFLGMAPQNVCFGAVWEIMDLAISWPKIVWEQGIQNGDRTLRGKGDTPFFPR